MNERIVNLAAAALLLAGCSAVGPDYAEPEQTTADAVGAWPSATAAGEAVSTGAPPEAWWRELGDTTLDRLVELAPPKRALKLNVSVPFHCSLLADAAAEFATTLDAITMSDPAFPVWCNVDAAPVTTAEAARDALKRQFAGSVRWLQTIEGMLTAGVREFVECGPKPTLVNMVKRIALARGVDGVETFAATTPDEIAALASR